VDEYTLFIKRCATDVKPVMSLVGCRCRVALWEAVWCVVGESASDGFVVVVLRANICRRRRCRSHVLYRAAGPVL